MTTTDPMSPQSTSPPAEATLHRIRFAPFAEAAGQTVLAEFIDPAPRKAVCLVSTASQVEKSRPADDGLDVLVVSSPSSEQRGPMDDFAFWVAEAAPAPPVLITIHGAQIIWGHSRCVLMAAADRVPPFLQAIVDFHHYERELRTLEREVRESWSLLEIDRPLAHEVVRSDSDAFDKVGEHMDLALQRRIRFARITPHLFQPRPNLPPLANQLMDRLRERTSIEVRHEALAAQLEVFDRVYEMNSQRISDFKAAQSQRTMEWIIIVLLAAETLLLLLELLRSTPTV